MLTFKKLFWRLSFEWSIQDWVFNIFTGPKKMLQIISAQETIKCWLVVTCWVSHLIRLKDSLISKKTGRNQLFNFLHWKNYQGKATLRLPFLVGCSQACLWTIQIPEFFDHQYVWKEIIATFVWPLSIFLIYLFPSLFMKYSRDPFSYDLPL